MKQSETEIIRYIRSGKRVNISEIARELKLPISTVSDRIKKIEQRYILKRSSILDYRKIGYLANEVLAIKVDSRHKQDFLNFLKKQNCVNSIYFIDSGFSFLVEIVCKDNFELIGWIEEVKSKFSLEMVSFQVLKVEEKEKFVPNEDGLR
jgi:DNA-binding Lrp family transcriptional regulator